MGLFRLMQNISCNKTYNFLIYVLREAMDIICNKIITPLVLSIFVIERAQFR